MFTNVFAQSLLFLGLVVAAIAQPTSSNCQGFDYSRHVSVATVAEIKAAMLNANAGDLIEIQPGTYYFGNWSSSYDSFANPTRGYEVGSTVTSSGNAIKLINKAGTSQNWITICGDNSAIIDGSDTKKYIAYGVAIQNCQYVRLAGLTTQWVRKGVDVQSSKYIDVYNVHTQYTLQEGIRFRYNTTISQARFCHIDQTGWLDQGNGEGIYIGTSAGNSIDIGDPLDFSDNNHFFNNTFGLNVTAENIDVKEFTTGGKIYNNTFEGYGILGINGAYSCVVLKGNAWEVFNNTCVGGRLSNFVGYRFNKQYAGWGNDNKVARGECVRTPNSGYCALIGSGITGNSVSCLKLTDTTCTACNCQSGTCSNNGFVESSFPPPPSPSPPSPPPLSPPSPPPPSPPSPSPPTIRPPPPPSSATPPPPPSSKTKPNKNGRRLLGGGIKPGTGMPKATNTLADPTGKKVYLPNMQPTTGRREPIEDTFSVEHSYRPFDD